MVRRLAPLPVLSCLLLACEISDTEVRETRIDRVLIHDQDGKVWDVTQAVVRFGFDPSGFQFGLGAHTMTPLVFPPSAVPGGPDYPGDAESFLVIGVSVAGVARAYRLDHIPDVEVVDDTLAATPVAVVHRPLTGEPSAHARLLGDTPLTLSASGWLYENQSVLFDYETESLWYRLEGESRLTCIAGTHFLKTLPAIAFAVQPWNVWRASHPVTTYMVRR